MALFIVFRDHLPPGEGPGYGGGRSQRGLWGDGVNVGAPFISGNMMIVTVIFLYLQEGTETLQRGRCSEFLDCPIFAYPILGDEVVLLGGR